MAHPYPLRYSLPLGFLVIGLAMIGVSYGLNRHEIERRNEDLMRQRVLGLGEVIVPDLIDELADARPNVVEKHMLRLRNIPQLRAALLCEDGGLIVGSTPPDLAGRTLADAARWAAPVIASARLTRQPDFAFSPDRETLWAAFPVVGADGRPALWLCTASDLAAQQAPAITSLHWRTATLALLALVICTGVWYYFSRTVTRRAMALVRITEAFAAGRLGPPLPTRGSDELAKLNAAFNTMARDLRARDTAIRLSEERFAHAIEASELGIWDWNLATDECTDNDTWWRMFGYARGELPSLGETWRHLCHPEDWPLVTAALEAHFADRTPHYECEHRMRHKSGHWVWVMDKGRLTERTPRGQPLRATGTTRDITARKDADALLAAQRSLLEGIATGQPLAASLDAICRFAESRGPGMLCSLLVLDRDGVHLRHGAAPSLPVEYCRAIDGVAAGPGVGSCGTAVFRRAQVIVTDIATDPLWRDFRALAHSHGLRACWSTPIEGADGTILGTFAIYYREPRHPAAAHEQLIQIATHTASIALHRARAAATLQASEARFGRAFGASPVPMFVSALADGRLLEANDAFARTFGFAKKADFLGRTSLELNLWDDPADRTRMLAVLRSGRPLTDIEVRFRRLNGETGHCIASAEIVEFDGEQCTLTLFHDITARKAAEERLRLAERETERHLALLEASLDGLGEGVMVFDLTGCAYYWNRAALKLHGYADLQACRDQVREFPILFEFCDPAHTPLPPDQWPLARVLRGEVLHDLELVVTHRGQGWRRWFAYSGTLARTADGQPLLAVLSLTDITGRRQLEEQYRQAQKMEAVGQLAGGMAHDFNNILTAVIVRSDLAALQSGVPADVRDALLEIRRLGQRAADLTGQLLAFSRRSVMSRRPLNFNDVAAADAKMITRLVGEQIRVELRLHPRALPVFADESMLGQVLLNLAVNARDAMPRGGRLLIETAARTLTGREPGLPPDVGPGPYACLRFSDTGSGIAPETLPRIFEPFFTTKDVGKGTGLGLATVFGIVRQHQGWITVESPRGVGAVFSIYLPLAPAEAEPAEADATAETLLRGTETILLVEDEDAVRLTTAHLLTNQGYQVLSAVHGVEARELWRRHRTQIDLLLTDIVMPEGVSGNELAAELQAEVPALPVILATGYSAEIAGRDLELPPHQHFLQKPFNASQLLAAVRSALEAR
jgi:two-component system cell cycle sensor histidine kinase/response regulator CckA